MLPAELIHLRAACLHKFDPQAVSRQLVSALLAAACCEARMHCHIFGGLLLLSSSSGEGGVLVSMREYATELSKTITCLCHRRTCLHLSLALSLYVLPGFPQLRRVNVSVSAHVHGRKHTEEESERRITKAQFG